MKLTRTDKKILDVLQRDSGVTNVELADRVGLSPSPCLRRVKQLEAAGLISGYVALLDRRKARLDLLAYVEVAVDRHNEAAAEAFKEAVLREPMVVGCHAMTGSYDYLLRVVAPNLDAYAEFTMKRLLKMPAVKDIQSSFVLETIKDSTALPLDYLE
ncbi:ArsR family transcriptional regulator [Caulobacter flavus]|jgi:Lrp/AsnC family leucine-responsive transcriptional regulator|uniref:ArsR family transcriptional regulator n=1 Tax=Caulobacter flavus TaxID=1679497 RepID=A0A2N5D524_9CAUL|nr:Lrp/AsnC family transcriptional regulator [Caulobacter flavus]AYV47166.1 ArsR family transcriptional regulator [Caulobacter flavus]PLR21142.1 ArsR family transcriptional regulator [Caulobacter flavus]